MPCLEPQSRLSEYADGELFRPSDRAPLEAHLQVCAECRLRLKSILALKRAVMRAPAPAMPAGLKARLLSQARSPRMMPVGALFSVWRRRYALASGLALAGLGAFALYRAEVRSEPVPLEVLLAAHSGVSQ